MLDKLDKELILELQQNGRQSFVDLARLLNVSEITIRRRVKHLRDSGIINIAAIPNLGAIGYDFVAIVGLQVHLPDLQGVATQISSHSKVCYLAKVTGRYDLMAIIIAKSSKEFADFLQDVISNIPGVARTETFVNLNKYKGQAVTLDIKDTSHLIGSLDTRR